MRPETRTERSAGGPRPTSARPDDALEVERPESPTRVTRRGAEGHDRRRRGGRELTPAQTEKLQSIPDRLHGMYRTAVTSNRRVLAIRLHCLACQAWNAAEVRRCREPGCVFYPYRLRGYPGHPDPRARVAAGSSHVYRQLGESPDGEGAAIPLPPGAGAALDGAGAPETELDLPELDDLPAADEGVVLPAPEDDPPLEDDPPAGWEEDDELPPPDGLLDNDDDSGGPSTP